MGLERMENESALQYHKRLVYGKLVDKTLSDYDYSELAPYVYGKDYAADVTRRMLYGSRQTLELMDREFEKQAIAQGGQKILDDLDARRIAYEKERQKFFDQRMAYNQMIRERAREEELNDMIRECIGSGKLPQLNYDGYKCGDGESTLLVSLNDLHYGAEICNAWCRYNSAICAEMMRKYLARIIPIAERHGCEDCVVWGAGDFISGFIHRSIQVSNRENVIEQIMGVSELIAEFLAELSRHFKTVRFISVAGNHSRLEANKDKSVTAERTDDLVEWYLVARMQNFKNVIITDEHKLDHTMSLFNVRGKNYCLVHGDFDGTPAKMQALQQMVGGIDEPLYAVLCGHLHHNQTNVVQGVRTVMAGSFQGMDDFCVEKRIVGRPEQMICVCDEGGIVCSYDIPLDE